MTSIRWRWEERDFGFRFKSGRARQEAEYYQGARFHDFYVVPAGQRKLKKARMEELASKVTVPPNFNVVPTPWQNYNREWDWIVTDEGLCLNYAGCLDREEIERREDEGVGRAMEYVAQLAEQPDPVPLSLDLLREVHIQLMGDIYPFAGQWRTVVLHKGDGPTKWPLPLGGIQPQMKVLERDVFTRSPFLSEEDEEVFLYASMVMNETLVIHPFREGNGRTAFILGNLILLQNSMVPLDVYDRRRDEARYFEACEAGRIRRDYKPLAELMAEWEDQAIARWSREHGF